MLLFVSPSVLALFLVGFALGRRGWSPADPASRAALRRAWPWCLGLGVLGSGVSTFAFDKAGAASLNGWLVLAVASMAVGGPALSAFYVIMATYLTADGRRPNLRRWLADVGRMALTNYLLQSVVCSLLFTGYGLGLYGRIRPHWGVLIAVGVFALQVPLSVWWLGRFRFGPMEWVWRAATYLHLPPMRVRTE